MPDQAVVDAQVAEIQRRGAELTLYVNGKHEVIPTKDIEVGEAQELRNSIKSAWRKTGIAYMEFGCLIDKLLSSTVNSEPVFSLWGFKDFQDCCVAEFNIDSRQAYYIRGAFLNVKRGFFPDNIIEDIGIAKTKELSTLVHRGILTMENKDKWLGLAKDKHWDEFKKLVQDEKIKQKVERRESAAVSGAPQNPYIPDEEMHQFQAYMPDSVYVLWQQALARAENLLRGRPDDKISASQKLNCIALDFIASHLDKREDALGVVLRRIEAFYDVRTFCLDPHDKAVHGEELAKVIEKAIADYKSKEDSKPTQPTSL